MRFIIWVEPDSVGAVLPELARQGLSVALRCSIHLFPLGLVYLREAQVVEVEPLRARGRVHVTDHDAEQVALFVLLCHKAR